MPTRKEVMEVLSDRISEMNEGYSSHAEQLDSFGDSLGRSSERLGYSIEKAGNSVQSAADTLIGGLIVAPIVQLYCNAIAAVTTAVVDSIIQLGQKSVMINSICQLQETHGPMRYSFAVKRAWANGAKKETKKEILNQLIYEGIVEEIQTNGEFLLRIDPESEALSLHWERMEALAEAISTIGKNKPQIAR